MDRGSSRIAESVHRVTATVGLSLMEFMLGALALVSALAWNEAFKNWFENTPELADHGPWFYALGVSLLSVGIGFAAFSIRNAWAPKDTPTFQSIKLH